MARYVIGDVQGCYTALRALTQAIDLTPTVMNSGWPVTWSIVDRTLALYCNGPETIKRPSRSSWGTMTSTLSGERSGPLSRVAVTP